MMGQTPEKGLFPPFKTQHKHPYSSILSSTFHSIFQLFSIHLHFNPFHSTFLSWELIKKSDVTDDDLCTVSNLEKEKCTRSDFIAPSAFPWPQGGRRTDLWSQCQSLTNLAKNLFTKENKYRSPWYSQFFEVNWKGDSGKKCSSRSWASFKHFEISCSDQVLLGPQVSPTLLSFNVTTSG